MQRERFHLPMPPRLRAAVLRRAHGTSGRRRQHGSVAIIVALFMTVVIAALGALDVGNVFFARRTLQRVADLAALAGAQKMDVTCTEPPLAAQQNAATNGFSTSTSGQTLTVVCGRWDIKDNSGPSYFSSSSSATPYNAVQVTASETVPYFFLGPARQLTATATAQATDIASFSVGTTLAQLQGGLVNGLLNSLLGTNLNLSLASYESLASAQIKVSDLMTAAGASTVSGLLSTDVDTKQLATLLESALANTTIPDVNLATDLATLQAIISGGISTNVPFPLGNSAGTPGLLSVGVSDLQSAVNATISPLDAIMVAAEIVQAGKTPVTINGGLNLPGLTTKLQAQIVQPPVLAVGEAGVDPLTGTWRTQASAAQVRLYLDINLGTTNLLPGLGTGVDVDVPLSLQAAPGSAWLESTDCTNATSTSSAVIGAQTGLATLCVANLPSTLPSASQSFSCPSSTPANIVSVNVVGLNLLGLKITVPVTIQADVAIPLASSPVNPPLTFMGTTGGYQTINSNDVGTVLVNGLSGALVVNLDGLVLNVGDITAALGKLLSSSLAPIIDNTVQPLLQLLGVQLGATTIHDTSLQCGVSQLVY